MMKKIKFHIVPHKGSENQRIISVPLFLLFVLLLVIFAFLIFFVSKFSYYVDVSSIEETERDNRILKKQISELASEKAAVKQKIDSLRTAQKEILKEHKLSLNSSPFILKFESLDSLVSSVKKIDKIFGYAIAKIKKKGDYIPSIMPVNGKIVKKFGKAWDPYTERWKPHNGIDISAPYGGIVLATANGVVEKVGVNRELGKYIVINHNNTYKTIYAHLSNIKILKDNKVSRGEHIGKVGKTGKTPFPMLYYEVDMNGKAVDPENFIFKEE